MRASKNLSKNRLLNITMGALALFLAVFATMAMSSKGSTTQDTARSHAHSHAHSDSDSVSHSHGADSDPATTTWHAVWFYTPQSVKEAYGLGSAAVLATVQKVEQADDIVVPAPGEPGGVDRVPTETITFTVDEVFKGQIDKSFKLFHTGNADYSLDGDPAYSVGEQYILFMLPQEQGRWLVVSPEGRYAVEQGKIRPMSEKPGITSATDMDLDSFRNQLKEANTDTNTSSNP